MALFSTGAVSLSDGRSRSSTTRALRSVRPILCSTLVREKTQTWKAEPSGCPPTNVREQVPELYYKRENILRESHLAISRARKMDKLEQFGPPPNLPMGCRTACIAQLLVVGPRSSQAGSPSHANRLMQEQTRLTKSHRQTQTGARTNATHKSRSSKCKLNEQV